MRDGPWGKDFRHHDAASPRRGRGQQGALVRRQAHQHQPHRRLAQPDAFYTERSTRDANRAFVRYADLLDDWTSVVADIGDRLNQPVIIGASSAAMRAAHHFVDPRLRRSVSGWDDLGVPPRGACWPTRVSTALDRLADDPSDLAAQQRMDAARIDYAALYEEAEEIALSSILAAGPPNVRRRPDGQPVIDPQGSDPVTDDPMESDDEPSSPRRRSAARVADIRSSPASDRPVRAQGPAPLPGTHPGRTSVPAAAGRRSGRVGGPVTTQGRMTNREDRHDFDVHWGWAQGPSNMASPQSCASRTKPGPCRSRCRR